MTTCASCGGEFERKYERQRLCLPCIGDIEAQRRLVARLVHTLPEDGAERLLRALVRAGLHRDALIPAAALVAVLDEPRKAAA